MLNVYRASAGSGKTYLLTENYLRLLFQEQTNFDNVLAVTFTNKATEEMKERIISQLYVLAHYTAESDFCKKLQEEFKLSIQELQNKSFSILKAILHNYSKYNVSTIDHFFQQTMRAFTREIGLQGGYNIELDQDKVLIKAVDILLDSLNKPEYKDLLNWLILFANDKIESGKDWNIRKDLLGLSKELFQEEYKRNSDKILEFTSDKKNLEAYIQELKVIKNEFEDRLVHIGKEGLEIMYTHNLKPELFAGKSRSPFFHFEKWSKGEIKPPTATFIKLVDNLPKWCAAKTDSQISADIESAYINGLNALVIEVIEHFENSPAYISTIETLRYIYTVGILSDIDRQLRNYCKDQNILLISDTTELLTKIIDGSDNPFIYEKLGTHIQHFMIDEFQDTSGMQWDNFKPLLTDAIAQGQDNLIVGDVKQSIYRWRSSDWMLLHKHIRSFASGQREDHVLNTNWRSAANVIGFNNSFFSIAANLLQDKYNQKISDPDNTIREAYDDICQYISPRKKDFAGHVRIDFIDPEHPDNLPESDDPDAPLKKWNDIALERLPETIKSFQDHGYSLSDIAILVRTGREGAAVAQCLLDYKASNNDPRYSFDVISNDSLYISQSESVRTIISFMKFLLEPHSPILQTLSAYNMLTNLKGSSPDDALREYFYHTDNVGKLFQELFSQELSSIRSLPLFEMTEKIISLITSPEDMSDKVYLQAFQDLVLEFMSSQAADLSAFILWWDERGVSKTISSPDSQEAIRIITIHKSKGLGFKAVVIPFVSWKIDQEPFKTKIIWCQPQLEPFNGIPLVPVRYGEKLLDTIYSKEYLHEKLQTYIDNLNIAYVAFTRAEEEMVMFAPKPSKPEECNDVASLLYSAVEWANPVPSDMPMLDLQGEFDPATLVFEAGTWVDTKAKNKNTNGQISLDHYPSIDPKDRLQLRLHGKGYFNDRQERIYGNLMHEILSSVKYPEEIEEAVRYAASQGTILQAEVTTLSERIHKLLEQDPIIRSWFDSDAQIYNETEILVSEGSFLRPDRIVVVDGMTYVIDYKFGHVERNSYVDQVSQYMALLHQMGFQNIVGYIWYVELQKIQKIDSNLQLELF